MSRKLQKEAESMMTSKGDKCDVLFPAIILTNARYASKELFARNHRIAEYHEETANYRKIAKEKGHVENETIAKPLNEDDGEKSSDGIFCITFRHDSAGGNKHGLSKESGDTNIIC